jgi:hypothetical protein
MGGSLSIMVRSPTVNSARDAGFRPADGKQIEALARRPVDEAAPELSVL